MPENTDPLEHVDTDMAQRAHDYLNFRDMIPNMRKLEASPDARRGLLRYVQKELQAIAGTLSEEVDPTYRRAPRETVLAYHSKDGDDMLMIQKDHITMQVENAVPLWPMYLLPEEKTSSYESVYLDPRGRIFGVGYERLIEKIDANQRFMPIEIPMDSMRAAEALALQQAAKETLQVMRLTKDSDQQPTEKKSNKKKKKKPESK